MTENETMKNDQRKADEGSELRKTQPGKQPQRKVKPSLVLQQLLKRVGKKKNGSASDIIESLKKRGINASRRLVNSDNNPLNWLLGNKPELEKAKTVEAKDEAGAEKMITFDKMKEDFLLLKRNFELNDLRLLAECIYSAKFLTEGQAKRLVDAVCESIGEEQAKSIKYDALLTDRVKTNNQSVILNIAAINDAMSRELEGHLHIPEKISFQYLKPSINEALNLAELSKGNRYVISPFKLMINDGNYYLLAFDDDSRRMRTYRVDRMKDIERTGEAREGGEIFRRIDLQKYSNRVFKMSGGRTESVKLCFSDDLLDTAIERFGASGVSYTKADDTHFTVTANVEISDRFFGWLLGLGEHIKILEPLSVVKEFTDYLDKIRKTY